MPEVDRGMADNLMLLCRDEHREIDRAGSLDVATIDWLRAVKADHEAHIRRLVSIGRERRTAVVRLIGDVYGEAVQVTRESAANVVLRENRYPYFPLSFDRLGLEIDLRRIPGEADGSAAYWEAARRLIDEGIDHRLAEAIRQDEVRHVSLFAFARLPLLVYLGSKLDDTFPVAIHQLGRDGSWDWKRAAAASFVLDEPGAVADDVVLLANISGTIEPAELPATFAGFPKFVIRPGDAAPSVDILESKLSLEAFERVVRQLLASLDAAKVVRRVHVAAALPVSAAVVLGRSHNPIVHPTLVIYARSGNGYEPVVEVS
jgi:hypothetical protein